MPALARPSVAASSVRSRTAAVRVSAVAAPLPKGSSSNGGGPHRLLAVQATLEDINKALGACIKQAADVSSLEKINKGIGKEISKAAEDRFSSK